MAIIGYYLWALPPVANAARDAAGGEVVAAALMVGQKAAVDWCLTGNCNSQGLDISGTQLTLPPGYLWPAWLHSRADGHYVWTYGNPPNLDAAAVAAGLGDQTFGGPSAGMTIIVAGKVILSARQTVPMEPVFPNGLPARMPVIVQHVK